MLLSENIRSVRNWLFEKFQCIITQYCLRYGQEEKRKFIFVFAGMGMVSKRIFNDGLFQVYFIFLQLQTHSK